MQLFSKQFWPEVKNMCPQLFRAFNLFNSGVQSQTINMRRMNENERKLVKDLVKKTSFIVKAVNDLFDYFEFNQQLKFNAVLTEFEEMKLADLLENETNSALVDLPSKKYSVYQFGRVSAELFRCNAS